MREILFRGKRIDNGKWVYGFYVGDCGDGCHEICDINNPLGTRIEVIPETVGQFTGLTDKNGKKIFEGDIGWDCHNECYGVVEFSDGKFSYVWENICTDLYEVSDDVDFIGNIHDNPELLGDGS